MSTLSCACEGLSSALVLRCTLCCGAAGKLLKRGALAVGRVTKRQQQQLLTAILDLLENAMAALSVVNFELCFNKKPNWPVEKQLELYS